MAFKELPRKPNFVELEKEMLEKWRSEGVFAASVKQREGKERFNFYQGPPTANGKPHIGHMITLAMKDIIPRYKTMKGYYVPRKGGWDTHGLPVELEVEKQLGIKSKPEIEKFGIAEFNAKCKESVWRYKEEWERITDRIGFWLDMERPYITYESDYIESVWWVLKQIWDKDLLYEAHKVVPYCPRCGTSLSSHEVALGYQTVKDASVYVRFPVVGGDPRFDDTAILSWTTTPWTLPGNLALAVNPAHEFVKVTDPKDRGKFLLLESTSFERLSKSGVLAGSKLNDTIPASELIGLSYEPLFDVEALRGEKSYKVYEAEFVTSDEGTGVVHTAVMYGEDDYELGGKLGLPQHHTVDSAGKFTEDVKGFTGEFVKAELTEKKLIEYISSSGRLLHEELYEHDYPFCWRCETPLLYYAQVSWFINMQKVKEALITNNEKINWLPAHLKEGRFGNFLTEIKDWALSRKRYWGTPLPIWVCAECDERTLVGSLAELKERAVAGLEDDKLDLHRPFIDEVELKCSKCAGSARRVEDLIDVWFDSGSMPYAQYHYPFENEDIFKAAYPADYISEAIDQTRGWFYTLLAISTLLGFEEPAYRNVITLGHGLAEDGKKMSKSRGNMVDPWKALDAEGADALRLYLFNHTTVGNPWRISVGLIRENASPRLVTWWNSVSFFITYANIDGVTVEKLTAMNPADLKLRVIDKWILARLNQTISEVVRALDEYEITSASKILTEFMDDLSNWYIRRNRRRFWKGGDANDRDKQAAYHTLWTVLTAHSRLMAPLTPFIADSFHRTLNETELSVHLGDYPETPEESDTALIKQMRVVRTLAELGLASRNRSGHKVRQPLQALYVLGLEESISAELEELITEELNVKELRLVGTAEELPKEGRESEGALVAAVDTELTEELIMEGALREITRVIQELRKKSGFAVTDRVNVTLSLGKKSAEVISQSIEEVKAETLAEDLTLVEMIEGEENTLEFEVLGEKAKVKVTKG